MYQIKSARLRGLLFLSLFLFELGACSMAVDVKSLTESSSVQSWEKGQINEIKSNASGTVEVGAVIYLTVTFSIPATFNSGSEIPYLDISANGVSRRAEYVSGNGTNQWVFVYHVQVLDVGTSLVYSEANGGVKTSDKKVNLPVPASQATGLISSTVSLPAGGGVVASTAWFYYTGALQNYVVPAGVTSLNVKLWGAGGGMGARSSIIGGGGGFVSDTLSVTPGETLTLLIGGGGQSGLYAPSGGGLGGFGGGGSAGLGGIDIGGGGGGRTAIQRTGADVITAGGGGGSQYNMFPGGGGGGTQGLPASLDICAGEGGTQNSGGAGGVNTSGINGMSGSLGLGGNGATSINSGSWGGAGGGGGYYGGGGGCSNNWGGGGPTGGATAGGGGGGSSYFTGASGSTSEGSSNGTPGGLSDPDYRNNFGYGAECYQNADCRGAHGGMMISFGAPAVDPCAVTLKTPGQSTWAVPTGCTKIKINLWGAGGGGSSYSRGGGGGFVSATLNVNPGDLYTIIVGQPGTGSGVGALTTPSIGGGYSAFKNTTSTLLLAGGGGGGGQMYGGFGGPGGAFGGGSGYEGSPSTIDTGVAGSTAYGSGGNAGTSTTSGAGGSGLVNGNPGTNMTGGNGGAGTNAGGGGGSGFFGGGGGGAGSSGGGGGGGGSNYLGITGLSFPGNQIDPGGISEVDYRAPYGKGGNGQNNPTSPIPAGGGLVVIKSN